MKSSIQQASIAHGGYAPSATFHLELADRRTVFFKGIADEDANLFMRESIRREERFYHELSRELSDSVPTCYGSFAEDGWHVLLLEDLGPPTAPPWRDLDLRIASEDYARFHRKHLGVALPAWIDDQHWRPLSRCWRQVEEPASGEPNQPRKMVDWYHRNLESLQRCAEALNGATGHTTLLHFDTRSDNLRIHQGRLKLFDWNLASKGPAEIDVAAFAVSICAEGGPAPEEFLQNYQEILPLDVEVLFAAASAIAGYFYRVSWLPALPEMPALRAAQRGQLLSCLDWLARGGVIDFPPRINNHLDG